MQVSRVAVADDGTDTLGVIDESAGTVTEIDVEADTLEAALLAGESWSSLQDAASGPEHDLDDVSVLAPVSRPLNLIGIGLNYAGHAAEGGFDVPEEPIFFAKSPSSITDPGSNIVRHEGIADLHYEAEFGFVVGETARKVSADDALDHVFGFLAANDVTARDMQLADLDAANPWFRSKSMDTFTPLSPVSPVGEGIDPAETDIEARLNGETVQSSNTSDLIFTVEEALAYVTDHVTLHPGDVVITGTPAGVGSMEPGDVIEVDVEGVSTLKNEVGTQ